MNLRIQAGLSSLAVPAFALVLMASSAASGATIKVMFEGEVVAGTVGWGTATVGDTVTGEFRFDDSLGDSLSATDNAARWNTLLLSAGITADLTSGGKTEFGDSANDSNGAFIQLFDDPNDTFGASVEGLNLTLLEVNPASTAIDALTDGLLDDPILNVMAIINNIDTADFTNSGPSTWIVDPGVEQIRFSLTSLMAVPEPSTALLFGLGLLGLGAVRRRDR